MTRRGLARVALAVGLLAGVNIAARAQQLPPPSAGDLAKAIDTLGSFDAATRTESARLVRRTPADVAANALTAAARSHKDEYVRYRALVLLAGLGDAAAADLMRAALADRNDRMRTVAAAWFEHHPDPAALPSLTGALAKEGSEFVRPALTRAVAAHGKDPRAQATLTPLVMRGEDFFRGAVIEALGDYQGAYALAPIAEVARVDGPLQDDAITAIGRIGDPSMVAVLIELQKSVPRDLQPTVSASLCLLGRNCAAHETFIKESLTFASKTAGFQPVLRGAVHALTMLARRDKDDALAALFDAGVPAADPAREAIALGVGLVALRSPDVLLRVLETRKDLDGAIDLVKEAFDMLAEDLEEERFYVTVRRAYWASPDGSPRKRIAETLILKLEF
jgi:HEAT repeat protein